MRTINILVTTLFVSALLCISASAEEVGAEKVTGGGKADLAKAAQNPVGDLISIPNQFNFNFGVGPDDDVQMVLNIQPVYPSNLSEEWNLINRLIMPVIDQPAPVDKFGLGDIQYQGFFSPAQPKGVIWGVGPVLSMPTATDNLLGSEKWSAGPGAVIVNMDGPWVYGFVVNNIWSFTGEDDNLPLNCQLHAYYNVEHPTDGAEWQARAQVQLMFPK